MQAVSGRKSQDPIYSTMEEISNEIKNSFTKIQEKNILFLILGFNGEKAELLQEGQNESNFATFVTEIMEKETGPENYRFGFFQFRRFFDNKEHVQTALFSFASEDCLWKHVKAAQTHFQRLRNAFSDIKRCHKVSKQDWALFSL